MQVIYPTDQQTEQDFGVKYNQNIKKEKTPREMYGNPTVADFYELNPDNDNGLNQKTIIKKQNDGGVPLSNIVSLIDSSSVNLPCTLTAASYGLATGSNPATFGYKQLLPLTNLKLSTPVKFDLNYSLGWYNPVGTYTGTIAAFTAPVYLAIGFFNYDTYTLTGTLEYKPFLNPKLADLVWTGTGFTFKQNVETINLLNTITRNKNVDGFGAYDFRNTNETNYRNKIDADDANLLLTSTSSQIGLNIACDGLSLSGAQQSFLLDQINNNQIIFTLSYSFVYYARLLLQ